MLFRDRLASVLTSFARSSVKCPKVQVFFAAAPCSDFRFFRRSLANWAWCGSANWAWCGSIFGCNRSCTILCECPEGSFAYSAAPCFLASNLLGNTTMILDYGKTCSVLLQHGIWKNIFCAFAAWNMEKHVLCFCSMEYGRTCSVLLKHGIWKNMFHYLHCVFHVCRGEQAD